MTLRELCEGIGVSRRAVQGYEAYGLVTPTGRAKRGYLLYDETSQDRIREIKLYQSMGFKLKEIVDVIDAPPEVRKAAILERIGKLQELKAETEEIICAAYRKIEEIEKENGNEI